MKNTYVETTNVFTTLEKIGLRILICLFDAEYINKSTTLHLLHLFSSQERREFGFVDIEEWLLPVTKTKVTFRNGWGPITRIWKLVPILLLWFACSCHVIWIMTDLMFSNRVSLNYSKPFLIILQTLFSARINVFQHVLKFNKSWSWNLKTLKIMNRFSLQPFKLTLYQNSQTAFVGEPGITSKMKEDHNLEWTLA